MHTTGQSQKIDNIRLRASGQNCNVIQYHRCGSPRPHEILAFPDRGGATVGFALVEAKGSGFQAEGSDGACISHRRPIADLGSAAWCSWPDFVACKLYDHQPEPVWTKCSAAD
jgi:hypothetical protein